MICFDREDKRFYFRSAAIILKDNKLLLNKLEQEELWYLPGGRNEFFEFSTNTLEREMKEELNELVEVERLLWVSEAFFRHEDMRYHKLTFYYKANIINESSYVFDNDEFFTIEEDNKIMFKWFDIDDLKNENVYPPFLKNRMHDLPVAIEHIMHDDSQLELK